MKLCCRDSMWLHQGSWSVSSLSLALLSTHIFKSRLLVPQVFGLTVNRRGLFKRIWPEWTALTLHIIPVLPLTGVYLYLWVCVSQCTLSGSFIPRPCHHWEFMTSPSDCLFWALNCVGTSVIIAVISFEHAWEANTKDWKRLLQSRLPCTKKYGRQLL